MKEKFKKLKNIDLVLILLYLGIIFHPESNLEKYNKIVKKAKEYLKNNTNLKQNLLPPDENVIILAGGTDKSFNQELDKYGKNIFPAFQNYRGIIISGGTNAGVCKLAGVIKKQYRDNIKLYGYIPSSLPADVEKGEHFKHFITSGSDFSILECLQYWYDILNARIDPSKVKMIGINGGDIAYLEYLIAIVFGAQVGIIEDSGRKASELIENQWWTSKEDKSSSESKKRLFKVVKNDVQEIRQFIFRPVIFDPDIDSLKKILIRHHESGSGTNIFELDISGDPIDNNVLSAFLTALDNIGEKELKVGEIISIKFKEAFLTGGFLCGQEFKIIFLLKDTPSKILEKKISRYIEELESKKCVGFHNLVKGFRIYQMDDEMENILKISFGDEISKLLG
jgi:hypothetical protein